MYTLTLSEGGLDPELTQDFTVISKNRVTPFVSDRRVTVKIKPTGEWTGTFVHPGTNKKTTMQGVSVTGQENAGFFLGGTEGGRAVIAPKAQ